jgi:hypothetical protein
LSFAQGRLWLLSQLHPVGTADLVPLAVRLDEPLDRDALSRAFEALQIRHEILRTTIEQPKKDEFPVRVIYPPRSDRMCAVALEGEGHLPHALQTMMQPFDLSHEPAWRARVFRLSSETAVLALVMHHIIWDEWSADIFRELNDYYSAACHGNLHSPTDVKPLAVQYYDFATWQRHPARTANHQLQLQYWRIQLEESVPAEFLCDFPRPRIPSYKAGLV